MKIRIKFSKTASMKFIGHLDLMRYFQKAMRRAEVDIAYSGGYSPHQIMSFASPLGLGATSVGEYMDIEVNSTHSSKEMVKILNDVMVDGIEIFSYGILAEDSKNAMSIVSAADYLVDFKENLFLDVEEFHKKINDFYNQDTIIILKKTKKSEKEVDIKPFIYSIKNNENKNAVFMKLATGSVNNLKPKLVMEAICQFLDINFDEFAIQIHRLDLYANNEDNISLISLEELGEEIE